MLCTSSMLFKMTFYGCTPEQYLSPVHYLALAKYIWHSQWSPFLLILAFLLDNSADNTSRLSLSVQCRIHSVGLLQMCLFTQFAFDIFVLKLHEKVKLNMNLWEYQASGSTLYVMGICCCLNKSTSGWLYELTLVTPKLASWWYLQQTRASYVFNGTNTFGHLAK